MAAIMHLMATILPKSRQATENAIIHTYQPILTIPSTVAAMNADHQRSSSQSILLSCKY